VISSYCGDNTCVQVDPAPSGGVYVSRRHTGDGVGVIRLRFSPAEWDAFLAGVVAGEFGLDRIHGTEPLKSPGSLPRVAPGSPDTPP
jgi:hypothetical protein